MNQQCAERDSGPARFVGRGLATVLMSLAVAGGVPTGVAVAEEPTTEAERDDQNPGSRDTDYVDGERDGDGEYCEYDAGKYNDFCANEDDDCADGEFYNEGDFCEGAGGPEAARESGSSGSASGLTGIVM